MSLTSYNGFTLAYLEQFGGFRYSSSAEQTLVVFKSFNVDPLSFSSYVFSAYAIDRINYHINRVLTTYPIGLNGVVATATTGSYSLYTSYIDWKITANFLDNHILDIMSNSGSISCYSYSSSLNNGVISIPWVKRDSNNNLISYTTTSLTGFQYSACAYDGYIIEDITL